MQAGRADPKQCARNRRPEQRMRVPTVQHHVQNGITMVQQNIQVGQGTGYASPQSSFPDGRASAHYSDANAGSQCQLGNRVHSSAFNLR